VERESRALRVRALHDPVPSWHFHRAVQHLAAVGLNGLGALMDVRHLDVDEPMGGAGMPAGLLNIPPSVCPCRPNINIAKVTKASGGRVGYIHVPDMGVPGLNEFAKYFYPQTGKEAMIVDVRSNGGGNVSPMIIERLRRELVLVDIARNGTPQSNPGAMIVGPKVLLADEFSASDGDLVTWRFKAHKIGPVIGKRTWGGVVGIAGTLPFLDGGVLNKPEFSRYDVAGKSWAIEGVGVEPDIFVDNDPAKEYAGEDQQLDKAISVILDLLKKQPGALAPMPPYPVKKEGSAPVKK